MSALDFSDLPKKKSRALDFSDLPKEQKFEVGLSEPLAAQAQGQILPTNNLQGHKEPNLIAPRPEDSLPKSAEQIEREKKFIENVEKTPLPIPEYQQKQETLDKILKRSPQIVMAIASPYASLIYEGIQQLKNIGVSIAKDESYSVLDEKKLTELLPEDAPTSLKVGLSVAEFGGDIAIFSSLANMAGRGILSKTLSELKDKLIKAGHPEDKINNFINTIEETATRAHLNPDFEVGRLKKLRELEVVPAQKAAPEKLSIVAQPRKPQEVIVPGSKSTDLAIITPQPPVPVTLRIPPTELRKFQSRKRSEDEFIIDEQSDAEMKQIAGQAKEARIREAANIIKASGAEFIGLQEVPKDEPLAMFNEPKYGSTGAIPLSQVTIKTVESKLNSMSAEFNVMGQNVIGAKKYPKSFVAKNIPEPKTISEKDALNRSLQRQAQTSVESQRSLQLLKLQLNNFIKARIPDTERGQFMDALAKATNIQDFMQVTEAVRVKSEQLRTSGARVFTEKEALKRSLQRQSIAATESANATTERLQEVKATITNMVKANLPLDERGRFINAIASAKTGKDVARTTVKVMEWAEKVQKDDAITDIKNRMERSLDSPSVDVLVKEKIKSIVSSIDFKGTSPKVREELRHTQAMLNKKILNGEDVTIPGYLQDAFTVLGRKSIKDLSLNELRNLQAKLNVLENVGRLKFARRGALYEAEKAARAKEIFADVSPIESLELKNPLPGQRLSTIEKLGNYVDNKRNQLAKLDLFISPINVVMDVMDGVKGFSGAHSRMKQQLDTKFGDFSEENDRTIRPVQEYAIKNKMDERNFSRIAVHAYRIQPLGRAYLLNNIDNPAIIESVKLTQQELELYKMMRDRIDSVTPRTQKALADINNIQMRLLPDYFPIIVDKEKISDLEVFQRVSDLRDSGAFMGRTKTVEQGFSKTRLGTKKKIVLNAMDVFVQRMEDELYFIHMQKDIKMFSEIIGSKEYKKAAGDIGALAASQWLDSMARMGGAPGVEHMPVMDSLRRNLGMAQLAFKLSSFIVQPSALGNGIATVGFSNVAEGSTKIILHRKWREFVVNNFPEIRLREGDDPAFLDLEDGKAMRKFSDVGLIALKKADLITASAVALGAYKKHLLALTGEVLGDDPGPVNKQAMILAQRDVQRSQASSSFKDAPLALTRGGSFQKALLQFQTFRLNDWSQYRHDFWRAGIKEGNYKRAAEIAFWLTMVKLFETGARTASKAGITLLAAGVAGSGALAWKEINEEVDNYEKNTLMEFLSMPPIFGDLISMGYFRSSPVPSFAALGSLVGGVMGAANAKTQGTQTKAISRVAEAAGSLAGVPGSSQAAQFLRSMVDTNRQSRRPIR